MPRGRERKGKEGKGREGKARKGKRRAEARAIRLRGNRVSAIPFDLGVEIRDFAPHQWPETRRQYWNTRLEDRQKVPRACRQGRISVSRYREIHTLVVVTDGRTDMDSEVYTRSKPRLHGNDSFCRPRWTRRQPC